MIFDNASGTLLGENQRVCHRGPTIRPRLVRHCRSRSALIRRHCFALDKTFDTSIVGYPAGNPWQHPTLYSVCKLAAVGTDTQNNGCRGMMGEAIDNVGGFGTFVEGGKFVGISNTADGTSGAWGVQAWAQSNNTQFTVGLEATVVKTGGSNAPGPPGFNPNSFAAGVVVSAGPTSAQKSIDVGYLINPFNAVKTSSGFACGKNSIEPTAEAVSPTTGGSAIGMDLSGGRDGDAARACCDPAHQRRADAVGTRRQGAAPSASSSRRIMSSTSASAQRPRQPSTAP